MFGEMPQKTDFIYSGGKGGMMVEYCSPVHIQTPAIALGQICISLLVNKEWNSNDWHSIIGRFHQGVEAAMGDEKAHFGMGLNVHWKLSKMCLKN
jgi:hypothetical protein